MFKKLKDKIAEEVKSSPQRIQQFTQSVTEKIQNATSEENFFSIGDDDAPSSSPIPEPGFSNISLSNYATTPNSERLRRNSNSSIASDMSFLPRYESTQNLYHLQSDLEVSASEVEDNVSTSSQAGHLSKEQVYAAFQKSQMRYHKYRGRYTDVAAHYKELERENSKMKGVLAETQDKALRRVAELKEQCGLEQKAKAHLENALRVELDEKQYVIDTLRTKVDLLQNGNGKNGDGMLVNVNDSETNRTEHLEALTKELKDSRSEVENLTAKLQELKANAIIFGSKESDLKRKVKELEETVKKKVSENMFVLERERENNLIIAQTKMELHTEIQNRDLEIENLKQDVETLKLDLEEYENKPKMNSKMENLQSQNSKLIEKVEQLAQKCNHYESEILKVEQHKIEIQNLNKIVARLQEEKSNLETESNNDEVVRLQSNNEMLRVELSELKEKLEKNNEEALDLHEKIKQQDVEFNQKIATFREDTKQSVLVLENKIRAKLKSEYEEKEHEMKLDFEDKILQLSKIDNDVKDTQIKLMQKEDEVKRFTVAFTTSQQTIEKENEKYKQLELTYLELVDESLLVRAMLEKEKLELESVCSGLQKDVFELNENLATRENDVSALNDSVVIFEQENVILKEKVQSESLNLTDMQRENDNFRRQIEDLENLLKTVNAQSSEKNDLQLKEIERLRGEVMNLQRSEAENGNLQRKINDLGVENEELNFRVAKLNEVNVINDELREKSRRLEVEIEDLRRNEDSNSDLRKQMDDLNKQKQELEGQVVNAGEVKKVHDELLDKNEKLERIIADLLRNEDDNGKLREEIDDLNQQNDKLKALVVNMDEVTKIRDELRVENETQNRSIAELKQALADKNLTESELEKTRQEHLILQELLENSKGKMSQSNVEIENLNSELLLLQNDKEETNKLLSELKQTLKTKDDQLRDSCEEVANIKGKCEEREEELKLKREENEKFESEIQKLRDDSSKGVESITSELYACRKELEILLEENSELKNQNSKLEEVEGILNSQIDGFRKVQETGKDEIEVMKVELENCKKEILRLNDDLTVKRGESESLMKEVTSHKENGDRLNSDYEQCTRENETFVTELAEFKLKYETSRLENLKRQAEIEGLTLEKARTSDRLLECEEELEKLKIGTNPRNALDAEKLLGETKTLQNQIDKIQERCEEIEKQKRSAESQLRELENQYTEISHENQLLKDEIQELKISPINIVNRDDKKLDNLDILISEKVMNLENTNDVQILQKEHETEINNLHEKLIQYKSLDLTNRSSIQFYENELQRLKNKNEKLNRKLDETLVTLNHCTELSSSTETEYLKNVLYNYMLGKESLVLARVIAAVCKFDDVQTDTILQREQQKQTLLGQFGIL